MGKSGVGWGPGVDGFPASSVVGAPRSGRPDQKPNLNTLPVDEKSLLCFVVEAFD